MKKLLSVALAATCLLLAACEPQRPLRIGFIGGLSDRNSDTGQAGLNGVQLAIEQANRAGGINGRLLELVVKDDAQKPEVAAQSARELLAAQVAAVIGPFTSSMAEVIVPILGDGGVFEVSPTITSMAFHGKDDNLFRINRTTRDNARDYARVLVGRGQKRIAVAYDLRNRNFTESWLAEFRLAVQAENATIAVEVPYESGGDTDFGQLVASMLSAKPDSLFFISGAVDVARLARASRLQAPKLPIGASEWAATEQLAKLGGDVVEGLLIVQNFDRDDNSPRFRNFADTFRQRFQRPPGYTAVAAYDAATVVIAALRARRPQESLKAAALRAGPYQGLQQPIVFDANGDTQRQVYFTEIHQGVYRQLPR